MIYINKCDPSVRTSAVSRDVDLSRLCVLFVFDSRVDISLHCWGRQYTENILEQFLNVLKDKSFETQEHIVLQL